MSTVLAVFVLFCTCDYITINGQLTDILPSQVRIPGARSPLFIRLRDFPSKVIQWLRHDSPAKRLSTTFPDCKLPELNCNRRDPYRTPDGSCNNLRHPAWGSPGWPFRRILPPVYGDGVNLPRTHGPSGHALPSPRVVSRIIHTSDSVATETGHLTSLFTHFGQFLDHDIDLTPLTNDDAELDCCSETIQFPVRGIYIRPPITSVTFLMKKRPLPGTCYSINIPQPDPSFSASCMNFVRSKVFSPSFKCKSATREQGNVITSFIDASQVYGSSQVKQNTLREHIGGRLIGDNDLLQANISTTCKSARLPGKYCFGAGDVRVNEHPLLSSIHVLFHRFHNQIADFFASRNRGWSDEIIFQETRKIIGALLQHIIYTEYLPLLLGPSYMNSYELRSAVFHRYDPSTDPRIMNSFATAAFRFGHSMVPGHLMFDTIKQPLEQLFFRPHIIQCRTPQVEVKFCDTAGSTYFRQIYLGEDERNVGLDNLVKGTLSDYSQGSDRFFSPALSQKLFQDGPRSLDLVSLNLQRGRDHGLPPYNAFREACGLPRLNNTGIGSKLFRGVYRDIDDVDLFTGALAEDHVQGGLVGPTFACIIGQQFRDLKFGDRFWYENLNHYTGFTRGQLRTIKRTKLASVLCAGSHLLATQLDVFQPVSTTNPEVLCEDVPRLDLTQWLDRSRF